MRAYTAYSFYDHSPLLLLPFFGPAEVILLYGHYLILGI